MYGTGRVWFGSVGEWRQKLPGDRVRTPAAGRTDALTIGWGTVVMRGSMAGEVREVGGVWDCGCADRVCGLYCPHDKASQWR